MGRIMDIIDRTELNAMVVAVKDEIRQGRLRLQSSHGGGVRHG